MHSRTAWGCLSSLKNNSAQSWRRSALVAGFFAVALSLPAAPLTGGFNMTGVVTVSASTIDWGSNGGTTGIFNTTAPALGDFAGIQNPTAQGTVKDLTLPAGPVSRFLDLFTAPGFGGLFFDLTSVIAPVAPACTGANLPVGTECSLGAFTLRNTVLGVNIDFAVLGFFQNGADLTTRSEGGGLYTTQLVSDNVATVYSTIVGGGSIAASYSANYFATAGPVIPEPATLVLFGAGLVAVGLIRRRNS